MRSSVTDYAVPLFFLLWGLGWLLMIALYLRHAKGSR